MFIFDVLARRSYFCHRWGKACSFLCIPFNWLFSRGQKKKNQVSSPLMLMATVLFCRSYNLDEGNKNIWIKIF